MDKKGFHLAIKTVLQITKRPADFQQQSNVENLLKIEWEAQNCDQFSTGKLDLQQKIFLDYMLLYKSKIYRC